MFFWPVEILISGFSAGKIAYYFYAILNTDYFMVCFTFCALESRERFSEISYIGRRYRTVQAYDPTRETT